MKTLYLTRGNNIVIDPENESADKLASERVGIDNLFYIKEPMCVVYGYDNKTVSVDVETGDIVIAFYTNVKNPVVIVKNEQWVENILQLQKEAQEEKERWATANINSEKASCDN